MNDLSANGQDSDHAVHDLVGGPFAVVESDPGVFTSLIRSLGMRGLEVVELYGIEPWAVSHLKPHGLIFCFLWHKDAHRPADFDDPSAEQVWFANQLNDDACASLAILNVLLNCPACDVGDQLHEFKAETQAMSPVMKGLAISNSPFIRRVHNALARPSDIRAAQNTLSISTVDHVPQPDDPPTKRRKTTSTSTQKPKGSNTVDEQGEETFHFIGYVPAYGKVWELDGLKSGPLEVGEMSAGSANSPHNTEEWMDIVRPALRMKMDKYGGSDGGENIRFSLMALVDDQYAVASDKLSFLRRERTALERRLDSTSSVWRHQVDPALLDSSDNVFSTSVTNSSHGFASDFGYQTIQMQRRVYELSEDELVPAWTACMQEAIRAKVGVDDELSKSMNASKVFGQDDHIRRTWDYAPFVQEFIKEAQEQGLLDALLDLEDGDGKAHVAAPGARRAKSKRET
ncbi:hypothetical protein OF83DRAFT_1088265 [Amylostereum chailletii]|nr:hypothetical protein OF83DRAFT_1088265 [Amylostereum chailletii]